MINMTRPGPIYFQCKRLELTCGEAQKNILIIRHRCIGSPKRKSRHLPVFLHPLTLFSKLEAYVIEIDVNPLWLTH